MKRDRARLIQAAGAERFVLDRVCLDDDASPTSEVEQVREALERVGAHKLPALAGGDLSQKFGKLLTLACVKRLGALGAELGMMDLHA